MGESYNRYDIKTHMERKAAHRTSVALKKGATSKIHIAVDEMPGRKSKICCSAMHPRSSDQSYYHSRYS